MMMEVFLCLEKKSHSLSCFPFYLVSRYASTPLETAKIVAKKLNPKFDIDLMIDELRFHLPDYSIYIEKSDVVFDCKSEDFFAKYPIGFLMELYRQGLVLDAFILPAIVPN